MFEFDPDIGCDCGVFFADPASSLLRELTAEACNGHATLDVPRVTDGVVAARQACLDDRSVTSDLRRVFVVDAPPVFVSGLPPFVLPPLFDPSSLRTATQFPCRAEVVVLLRLPGLSTLSEGVCVTLGGGETVCTPGLHRRMATMDCDTGVVDVGVQVSDTAKALLPALFRRRDGFRGFFQVAAWVSGESVFVTYDDDDDFENDPPSQLSVSV